MYFFVEKEVRISFSLLVGHALDHHLYQKMLRRSYSRPRRLLGLGLPVNQFCSVSSLCQVRRRRQRPLPTKETRTRREVHAEAERRKVFLAKSCEPLHLVPEHYIHHLRLVNTRPGP
jgi:hypothetical protein